MARCPFNQGVPKSCTVVIATHPFASPMPGEAPFLVSCQSRAAWGTLERPGVGAPPGGL